MTSEPVKRGPGRPRKTPLTEVISPQANTSLKVHIYPFFTGEDNGEGGIRRVVEAQYKHLPKFGISIVDNPDEADVIAYHATVPPAYINRFPRKPFVAMCHGLYWSEYEWGNWALQANSDVMEGLRVADAITAPSEWVANNIRRHTSRPVNVVYHGVDMADWPRAENPGSYVLWNKTRPDPICDPEPLNELAKLLPDVHFITTFGEERDNVQITGKLPYDKAQKVVQNAGAYLCTTRETFGIGTLEAMASGVPIVGFDFAGQAEFVESGKDGILVVPGEIAALADAVRECLSRTDLRDGARRKAEEFSWDRACAAYADIFRDAFEKRQRESDGEHPRTSIIVTNYNLHKYLPAALKSIQDQTDQDWECLVVDDASPNPQGREIVEAIHEVDPRFVLIKNEKNQYLAEARNTGIGWALGRYILPLDADDMLDPQAVQLLADALDQDRKISIAYGNVLFVEEDGIEPTDYSEFYAGTGIQVKPGHSNWPFPFTIEQQLKQQNLLPYSSMFRREVWENVAGYRSRQRTAEDAEFWTRSASFGYRPKLVTDQDTLIYRNRPESMSRKQKPTDWAKWLTWAKLPNLIPAGAGTKEQLPVPSLDPIVISVIIPVGPGHEKLVYDAIDSVMAQTFQNWECIVINDTGGRLGLMPPWVRVMATEGKTGAAHSRNVGISASHGRLFLPLDADDYLEPFALEAMYRTHKIEGDVVYSDFWQELEPGKITKHECDDYDPELITGKTRQKNGQMRMGMIHTVTALTPKKYWEEVGGYDESIHGWEDWDFQLSIADKGHCSRRVAAPLFMYRKYTGFRREENMAEFNKSKEGILKKWNKLWEGGQKLMACGSCSARRSVGMPQASRMNTAQAVRPADSDAVLIRCIGENSGAQSYRGASKVVYNFDAGDEKYVLSQDAEMFLKMSNLFQVVEREPEPEVMLNFNEPVLVADGPPAN